MRTPRECTRAGSPPPRYDWRMKVEGAYTFAAAPQQVWDLLLDPRNLQSCIPGCEQLNETGPDRWDATLKVGVGAVKGTYKSTIAIVDKQEPTAYTLNVEGRAAQGFVKGTAHIVLSQDGDGTRVAVAGDGQVGGPVAGVGQRMLGGVANMLMNQFFQCLRGKLPSQGA